MKWICSVLTICMMTAFTAPANGDTLKLKDGSVIKGTMISSDEKSVLFKGPGGIPMTIPVESVAGIEMDTPAGGAPQATGAPSRSAGMTIPAGTEILVRLVDPIDSTRAAVGEVSRGILDMPVVVEDVVAIKNGADVLLQLVRGDDKHFYVKLNSIAVAGKTYPVEAGYAQVKAKAQGSKVAKRAVGLGALGAAIGGIAGGGKGALIGVASGAGLGAITGAASGGKVQLPSETRLSYELRSALVLN